MCPNEIQLSKARVAARDKQEMNLACLLEVYMFKLLDIVWTAVCIYTYR